MIKEQKQTWYINYIFIPSEQNTEWAEVLIVRILEAKAFVQKKNLIYDPSCFQSAINEPFSVLSDVPQHLDELFTKTEFLFIFNLHDLKNEN